MIPELVSVFENDDINKFETRLEVLEDKTNSTNEKTVYVGKYPLLPFRDGMRGTFGGEFIAQGILAAWQSIPSDDFTPHSLHAYFLKAGSIESPTRWEILKINDGRNFINRLVKAYQVHTNQLVYSFQISFTKNNDFHKREETYQQQLANGDTKIRSIPFQTGSLPGPMYYKYKDSLDDLPLIEHTHEHVQHIVPPEFFKETNLIDLNDLGNKQFGLFCRMTDDLSLAKNPIRTKFAQVGFLSDSLYLASIVHALGLSLAEEKDLFRVSLDHSLYFHDFNFDPTDWLYLDYRFEKVGNDRCLVHARFFTIQGKLFATVTQEALLFLNKRLTDHATAAHERFHKSDSTTLARL
ncbi:HotDog domain-containing protein [Scheffersomyces amazonensis]|uniref:HotDog domain-containing protein n=1 Tax=Scheffersomyces amazonensis TaxID=1078765 RepID=UPI00315CB243